MGKEHLRSICWGLGLVAALLTCWNPVAVMANEGVLDDILENRSGILSALIGNSGDSVAGGLEIIEGMLNDIEIDSSVTREFNRLYDRHSIEITRLLKENPDMVWDTLDVVLNSLSTLKDYDPNSGRLLVDRRTFSKALDLLSQFEAHASPQLEEDVKKARRLLESRTRDTGSEQLLIDLGR